MRFDRVPIVPRFSNVSFPAFFLFTNKIKEKKEMGLIKLIPLTLSFRFIIFNLNHGIY